MGSNREIKSDGEINITSTRANVSGDLDVTGSINNFTFLVLMDWMVKP